MGPVGGLQARRCVGRRAWPLTRREPLHAAHWLGGQACCSAAAWNGDVRFAVCFVRAGVKSVSLDGFLVLILHWIRIVLQVCK